MANKKEVILGFFVFLLSLSLVSAFPSDFISHWNFDENVLDETSNYNGIPNSIIYKTGVKGQAVYFNSTGFVNFGDILELNNADQFTIAGWIQDDNMPAEKTLFNKDNGINNDIFSSTFLNRLYFEVGNAANSYSYWDAYNSEITQSTFYHAAFVFNGSAPTNLGKAKLYIDGEEKLLNFAGTFPSQTANLFGKDFTISGPSNPWSGAVDDVFLYDRTLTKEEINQIYALDTCGNGIVELPEECDDANTNNYDECNNYCEFGLREIPLETCQGEADLFAYHTTPMQDLEKEFITQRDELYVMTRADYISNIDVYLNNVLAPKTTVISTPNPFGVKIYRVITSPGDLVRIQDHSLKDSRAIQGILAQDSANPAININSFNIVFDDHQSNILSLLPGNYDFIVFDKYSSDPPGFDPDNRRLTVTVEDSLNNIIFQENYTDPAPGNVEGFVLDSYTIPSFGEYEFTIDTEDSVYWFLQNCTANPPCPDQDNDGVCDKDDECPNSSPNEPVDEDGCDPFQFCSQFSCGYDCLTADFMDNEQGVLNPRDCTVVILNVEGQQYPACRPTQISNMCFG